MTPQDPGYLARVRDSFARQQVMHTLGTVLDVVEPGHVVLSMEFKLNLLAPARGPWFRFEGRVVKAGRTISVVDGRALQHEPGSDQHTPVATMTATVMAVRDRDGIRH